MADTSHSVARPAGHLRSRNIFGLDFIDAKDVSAVAEAILLEAQHPPEGFAVSGKVSALVVTPNVDQLVQMSLGTAPQAAAVNRLAGYVLPDGQPLVWASRLLGAPLRSRLSGSDLVAALWPHIVAGGKRVLVVASSDLLAAVIAEEHAQADSLVAPHFGPHDESALDTFINECLRRCTNSRPDFIFLTLGFPHDASIMNAILRSWSAALGPLPVMLAIGGSFELYYGLRRRAPRWVQRAGLEWFFRFVQEPRRLFHRYFIRGRHFPSLVWGEYRDRRSSGTE